MGTAAVAYRPRHPEQSLLHAVIADHLETFLARQAERDHPVPGFVEERSRTYFHMYVLAINDLNYAPVPNYFLKPC